MGTVIVKVSAECEGLIGTLPRGREWELIDEEYAEDGTGTITIGFDGNDLTASDEQALNTNSEVISYELA